VIDHSKNRTKKRDLPATESIPFYQKIASRRAKIFHYLPRPPSGGTRARVEASLLLAQPTLRYPLHHPLLYIYSLLELVLKTSVPKRNAMTTLLNFSFLFNRINRLVYVVNICLHCKSLFTKSIVKNISHETSRRGKQMSISSNQRV
jgi:hypothetical protein